MVGRAAGLGRWQSIRAPAGMICHGVQHADAALGGPRGELPSLLRVVLTNRLFSSLAETMAAPREWSPMVSLR